MKQSAFYKGQRVIHRSYGSGTVRTVGDDIGVEFDDPFFDGHRLDGTLDNKRGWFCMQSSLKGELPFKVGERVTISSRPPTYSVSAGGECGRDSVKYPYTFTVKNIEKYDDFIAIFDGRYGWTYYQELFSKVSHGSHMSPNSERIIRKDKGAPSIRFMDAKEKDLQVQIIKRKS